MTDLFYRFLMCISGVIGLWFFKAGAWCVAAGYYVLFPGRVGISVDFYKALFPDRGFPYHYFCAWRQFHNFTTVFLDRWLARIPGNISYSCDGWEHIEHNFQADETGGILLMSHLGNWELGASYLRTRTGGPAIKLLLYLGEKQGEQIERLQKNELALQGVKIIATKQDEPSPFELVEGINFLKDGGFVSMTGDRLWSAAQRAVIVKFLGCEAIIPAAPFQFALLSGSPLLIFFVNRIGKGRYHCTVFPPFLVTAASRKERAAAIQQAAQHYAVILETMVRKYPFEWYHFERFMQCGTKK
jgi:predicted LPLAT superfamily acyltransferase